MASKSGRSHCFKCKKERATSKCGGCQQDFCWNDLVEHRQSLTNELDELQTERNLLRQALTEKTTKIEKHPIIDEINQWEAKSIKKIQQMAENARKTALTQLKTSMNKVDNELNILTNEIKKNREENDFFETDLRRWKSVLDQLKNQLERPKDVTIHYKKTNSDFINEISIVSTGLKYFSTSLELSQSSGMDDDYWEVSAVQRKKLSLVDDRSEVRDEYVDSNIPVGRNGRFSRMFKGLSN